MPLPAEIRLCAYGDSHLAALKQAVDDSVVPPAGVDIEFWGAFGESFRDIYRVNGRMRPMTDPAREKVAIVNGRGRDSVGPDDFDVLFFFGARLRTHYLFYHHFQFLLSETAFVSETALQRIVQAWLKSCRSYRVARSFARDGGGRVFFAPATFLSQGVPSAMEKLCEIAPAATPEQCDRVWHQIARCMQEDGVELIRQPPETLAAPCMTRAEYACDGALENDDAVHRNARYAALIWSELFSRLHDDMPLKPSGGGEDRQLQEPDALPGR